MPEVVQNGDEILSPAGGKLNLQIVLQSNTPIDALPIEQMTVEYTPVRSQAQKPEKLQASILMPE